uniref:HP1078 n=1 Tax=Helicobacter pylori TaxID=210 RepID=B9U2P9_HELPX|nr:HP1078 [Helicobacter pylori]
MADKEILIFVEGPSDKVFLEVYLYFLEDLPIKNFKVKDVKGKDNLSKRLLEIEKYDKTLIVFDADNYKSNKKEILTVVSKTKQTISEEQIFLFPNNQDDGDLETLLLKIAKHDEFLKCFEGYLECIKSKEHYKPIKNIRKNMLYAYLELFELEKFFQYKWDTNNKKNEEKITIDDKGKIKEEHKEEYEKLKEVIDFNSNSLIPLKDFLGQFAK